MQKNSVLVNTVALYILQISKYIFPLFTFPYLTRVLKPENYGIMTFANSVMVYYQLLIDFGFLQSATRDCSLFREDKKKLAKIVVASVQAKLILGLIGITTLIPIISFCKVFQNRELYTILSFIPVITGVFSIDYLFRGLEIMKVITYRTIAGRVIYTISIFLFIHKSEQYLLIPIISAFGEIIILIWAWYYAKKVIGLNIHVVSIRETLLVIKESAMFFLSRIASTIYTSTNTVLLGAIYNNTELAQFGVANALITNIRYIFSPIADSLYPYMIRNKDYKLIKKILLVLMPIILLGTICLYFLAEPLILLMSGSNYKDAIPIFRAFLPLVFITLPVYLFGFPVLGALGKLKEANLSVVYAAIFHMLGLIILYKIGKINFLSIAFLSCGSEMVMLLLRVIYAIKEGSMMEILVQFWLKIKFMLRNNPLTKGLYCWLYTQIKAKPQQAKKRKDIKRAGFELISKIHNMFKPVNVFYFVDFGTLLGMIREGDFIKHDLDIDIGVVLNGEVTVDLIRNLMQENGFLLKYEFIYNGMNVEDSFLYKGIKVDIDYYINDDLTSKCYLFYRKPDLIYEDNEFNVVELNYSKIIKTTTIEVKGIEMEIPQNVEKVLVEKYGSNWKIPDPNWVYWKAPNAKYCEEIGVRIVHN